MSKELQSFYKFLSKEGGIKVKLDAENNMLLFGQTLKDYPSVLILIVVSCDDSRLEIVARIVKVNEINLVILKEINIVNENTGPVKFYIDEDNGYIHLKFLNITLMPRSISNMEILTSVRGCLDTINDCYEQIMQAIWK